MLFKNQVFRYYRSQLGDRTYQLATAAIGTVLLTSTHPVIAHKIQVAGDVAGLWHVEPNHNPKAGEETLAWVALTRKGGKLIPFADLNCGMGIYSQPRQINDSPILTPNVVAVNAEKYQGIPGVKVTFPSPGLYQLQLDCQPSMAAGFTAFQLTHDVTVIAGSSPVQKNGNGNQTSQQKQVQRQEKDDFTGGWNLLATVMLPGVLVIAGLVWLMGRLKA